MGIGPFLECPEGLVARIPKLVSSVGVKVEVFEDGKTSGYVGQYVFRTRVGRVVGRHYKKSNVDRIWLVFPREHAFNPLHWPADFRLSVKIERMLRENGARACRWDLAE